MEWLNNGWVIGIGGGVISGLMVTAITRYFLSNRDNKEYLQKVASVNREVTHSIQVGIAEEVLPSHDILESLISATARRYGVDRKDVYGPKEISEELIKEVMDSSFIPAKTKEAYCDKLSTLGKPQPRALTKSEIYRELSTTALRASSLTDYRRRTVEMMSMTLGTMTALTTLVLTLFSSKQDLLTDIQRQIQPTFSVLVPIIITMTAVLISMILNMSYVRERRQKALRDETNEEKETNEWNKASDQGSTED